VITRAIRCLSLLVALGAVAVSAQQAVTAPAFRFERPIVTGGTGPRRLPIDVPLLAGTAPFRRAGEWLRDLRLYDASGSEVGYLLVGNPAPTPTYKPAILLPVASVDTPTEKTSGFEADLGEPAFIDRFRVDGMAAPFLKRLKLEASGDREHWTLLVAEGTLFDLPDERLRLVELRFRPGSYRYLRVTWDDTHSGRLSRPARASAGIVPPNSTTTPPLTTPLVFERRPSEPGLSRFRVRLPAGHLPISKLHLDVGGSHILRAAKVFEARLSGTELRPVMLGRATLSRVVRDDLTAADLHIDLEPPTEAQLDLEIDDGDNPPLDLRGVTAEFVPLPWIYFEAPATALTARYGNPVMTAPRYDIEAARDQVHIDAVADASWGEARARAESENATPAPPLPTVGAAVDSAQFKYLRAVPAGDAGLIAVGLDANVLGHSAGPDRGFADLRVVDNADRQIPYIIEHASEPLSLDLALEKSATTPPAMPAAPGSARSVYRVSYPVSGLPPTRLVLTTPARVFDRQVTVAEPVTDPRGDAIFATMATAEWRHADQDKPAMPLTLAVRQPRGTELLIIVDEGDNAPLPIANARLLLPAYRIRLFRDASAPLRVAYGRAGLSRPQYDLALLAPQLLGAPATDVALDAERPAAGVSTTAALVSPGVFWAALTIAVVVLIGLIVRLLGRPA
jgi:uncharacterized protein DUF3999